MNRKINLQNPLVTLGSPYGIGYEIFLLSLNNDVFQDHCPICIGSEIILNLFINLLNIKVNFTTLSINNYNKLTEIKNTESKFILLNIDDNTQINSIDSINNNIDGKIAFKSIDYAADLVNKNIFKSIVTLPVNKKNINYFDSSFFGHTEFFQKKWNENIVFMTFISEKLNLLLLTTHIPLMSVSKALTPELLEKGIECSINLKNKLKMEKEICFLGLNPHAGENGLLGDEEIRIKKIIQKMNKKHKSNIIGPIPADTAFTSNTLKKYSIYIACYHDQGLIPFKMLSFRDGVNLSYGMRYIRTSVDHGTAVDLIGKKIASNDSYINAYKLAIKLS